MNWYLLTVIPVFGLLVLVHEFGHFITAKWAGIRVEEFGLGFPPRLVGIRKRAKGGWQVVWFGSDPDDESLKQTPLGGTSGGVSTFQTSPSDNTIYSLNLIPIGGFVRMPGENGDVLDSEGTYDPQSFAAKSAGKRIIVLCAGVVMNFLLAMVLFSVAYSLGEPTHPQTAMIGQVVAGSPAAAAGLRPDDTILSVNGHKVKLFTDMRDLVSNAIVQGKGHGATVPVTLVVQHQGSTTPITTVVNARVNPPVNQGAMGISEKIIYVKSPIWQAPFKGIAYTFQMTHDFLAAIGQMIIGKIQPQLIGPVGIAGVTAQVAQSVPSYGWWDLLSLTALLSINLAVVNILPFPALDGGRVVLILIEIVRGGKRLKPEREGMINFIGMAFLLALMVVITISDVMHWGS